MYVTPQEFKSQVRELRAEINAAAKDIGGDIQYLFQRLNELQDLLNMQQEVINKLTEKLGTDENIR